MKKIQTRNHSQFAAVTRFLKRSFSSKPRLETQSETLGYQTLEGKRLLAAISFNANTGSVFIGGTQEIDNVLVVQNGSQITVTQSGGRTGSETFDASLVNEIRFVGQGGDDRFENQTSINSFAFAGAGNDTLIGGSGNDRLVGMDGDDIINTNGGDDVVVAGEGNDTVDAGEGNDRVLGGEGDDVIRGNAGDDVIFGFSGNDTLSDVSGTNRIIGGDGIDQIIGGSGNDRIFGGDGNDVINGNGGDDDIFGQNGNDTIFGGTGSDFLNGNAGDDVLFGQSTNDILDGGGGSDVSQFVGSSSAHQLEELGTNLRVTSSAGGIDTLRSLETLRFSDGDSFTDSEHRVFVQPIVVSNSDGSNTASSFGDAAQQADIENRIDEIFAVAGIDIQFLDANTINNSTINVGSGTGVRDANDLFSLVSQGDAAGVGSSNPDIIDLYFVERVPGFGEVGELITNGIAIIDSSGIAVQVGDNLLAFDSDINRAAIARTLAHEIAHNLGLFHTASATNLLNPVGTGTATGLNSGQISTILSSSISAEI